MGPHPFLLEADEALVVLALQPVWGGADQGAELRAGLPGPQQLEEALQGGRPRSRGRGLLLLQVVALLLGKVDKNLEGERRLSREAWAEVLEALEVLEVMVVLEVMEALEVTDAQTLTLSSVVWLTE